jgi:AraC-like DNA-binding protein
MKSNLFYGLKDLVSRHGRNDSRPCEMLPFLYVTRFDSTMPPIHHLAEPTVSIMLQGSKKILLDEMILNYRAGEALINSIDLPITVHMSKATKKQPIVALGIALNPSIIASLLIESKKQKLIGVGMKVASASEDLLDAAFRLVKLLDHPEDIPVLGAALEREFHWRVLQSEFGIVAGQLGQRGNHTIQIGNAVSWIRKNFNKIIRIEHLAKLAAMSPTSFHRHFRMVTSFSPVQYQKKIRLQEARIRLMSTQGNISSIGFEVGYDSPSQFSREYRREFGVSPKNDLQTHEERK